MSKQLSLFDDLAAYASSPSQGLAVTDELIGKGAIAREKRKNKKRLSVVGEDSSRTAISQKAIANRAAANSTSPGETVEQTPDQAGQDEERSAYAQCPMPNATLITDLPPEPPAPSLEIPSIVSAAGETIEKPETAADGGIEQSPATTYSNKYSCPGETIEKPSGLPPAPPPEAFLQSHYRKKFAPPEDKAADDAPSQDLQQFPPTHPEGDRGWEARGWFVPQYKWFDESGQHTSNQFPTTALCVKVYGPYVNFCYYREGKGDRQIYLGSPRSLKYQEFVNYWKQCTSIEQAIEFLNKNSAKKKK